jgi:SAM-dependent methyltransferase
MIKRTLKRLVPPLFRGFLINRISGVRRILLYPYFFTDFRKFRKLSRAAGNRFLPRLLEITPCLGEATATTGFDNHYVFHPAWAARIVAAIRPNIHIDISSSLHFVTIVSAFVHVKFYDYRPVQLNLSNLDTGKADLLNLPFEDNSIQSLSCMHTVEHVGLGRYGDPIDPDGDLKAIKELQRVLSPGGSLLFVVPVGRSSIEFNAQRIYSYDQIVSYFSELELQEFALIPDKGGLIANAPKQMVVLQSYGCGCFWFKKSPKKTPQ